jgi:hypothetical protein
MAKILRPGVVNKALAAIYGEGVVLITRHSSGYYYFRGERDHDHRPESIPSIYSTTLEDWTLEEVLERVAATMPAPVAPTGAARLTPEHEPETAREHAANLVMMLECGVLAAWLEKPDADVRLIDRATLADLSRDLLASQRRARAILEALTGSPEPTDRDIYGPDGGAAALRDAVAKMGTNTSGDEPLPY